MEIHIQTVQVNISTEHILFIGLVLWAILPKLRRLFAKRK